MDDRVEHPAPARTPRWPLASRHHRSPGSGVISVSVPVTGGNCRPVTAIKRATATKADVRPRHGGRRLTPSHPTDLGVVAYLPLSAFQNQRCPPKVRDDIGVEVLTIRPSSTEQSSRRKAVCPSGTTTGRWFACDHLVGARDVLLLIATIDRRSRASCAPVATWAKRGRLGSVDRSPPARPARSVGRRRAPLWPGRPSWWRSSTSGGRRWCPAGPCEWCGRHRPEASTAATVRTTIGQAAPSARDLRCLRIGVDPPPPVPWCRDSATAIQTLGPEISREREGNHCKYPSKSVDRLNSHVEVVAAAIPAKVCRLLGRMAGMSSHEIDRAIDTIARRQHGVLAPGPQAPDAGMTVRMIDTRRNRGCIWPRASTRSPTHPAT